tara:strand:- start:6438 stop:7049 length:612 start_codon:yes stop_codon:yes gene_type:complete
MRLFNDSSPITIISYEGKAIYYPTVIDKVNAQKYFNRLKEEIEWQHDELVMFGKTIITDRKVAWYGIKEFEYTYSKKTKKATLFNPLLKELKEIVEKTTGAQYNSCLLNFYHNGNEGMGWHADDEKELTRHSSIASISLGAERRFIFKHKSTKEKAEILLENGSLVDMHGEIQDNWLHSLPKTKKVNQPRINLTFRNYNISSL